MCDSMPKREERVHSQARLEGQQEHDHWGLGEDVILSVGERKSIRKNELHHGKEVDEMNPGNRLLAKQLRVNRIIEL